MDKFRALSRSMMFAGMALLVILCGNQGNAQGLSPASLYSVGDPLPEYLSSDWRMGLGLVRYINSFASWQIRSGPGGWDPLSRLEWPFDQWFASFQITRTSRWWDASVLGMVSLNKFTPLKFQDSDWTDGVVPPWQKTIFSESKNRVDHSYGIDFTVFPHNAATDGVKVGPVLGWRYQLLSFNAMSGTEKNIIGDPPASWSQAIETKVYFYGWYVGGAASVPLRVTIPYRGLSGVLEIGGQGDYSWVFGRLRDRHMLRGDLQGHINSKGWGYHFAVNAAMTVGSLKVTAVGDFKRYRTVGTIHTLNDPDHPATGDIADDGAHLWSDQKYVGLQFEYLM
jgi:hypothetical protein